MSEEEAGVIGEKKTLLNYVSSLREQAHQQSHRSGLTFFALCGALVYVIWDLTSIGSLSQDYALVCYFFANSYMALVGFLIIMEWSRTDPDNPFNRRIGKFNSDMSRALPSLLFKVVVPLSVSLYVWFGLSPDQELGVFAIKLGSVPLAIFLIAALYAVWAARHDDYPDPSFISEISRDRGEKVFGLLWLFGLVLTLLALHGVVDALIVHGAQMAAARIGFDLLVATTILSMMASLKSTESRASLYAEIERDIVVHGIGTDEIIKRLEASFLGRFLGDWVDEKMRLIDSLGQKVMEEVEKNNRVLEEVAELPSEFLHEKEGRLVARYRESMTVIDEYAQELSKLQKWIRKFTNSILISDDRVSARLCLSKFEEMLEKASVRRAALEKSAGEMDRAVEELSGRTTDTSKG